MCFISIQSSRSKNSDFFAFGGFTRTENNITLMKFIETILLQISRCLFIILFTVS